MQANNKGWSSKNKKTLIMVGIIILLLVFSVDKGAKLYSNLVQKQKDEIDVLTKESKKREDSLISLKDEWKTSANANKELWQEQERRNNRLYGKLKKLEASFNDVDTIFISNAKRIAESSNRFYQKNDTIR